MGISLGGLISQIVSIKFADRVNSLTLCHQALGETPDPTIPEMDTSILDFHSKAGTVNWTNEDSVVNYLIQVQN